MRVHRLMSIAAIFVGAFLCAHGFAAGQELSGDIQTGVEAELTDIRPELEGVNPESVAAFSDGLVHPLMSAHNIPSGAVAIAQNGRRIFAKGYGYQDIDQQIAVDPDTTLFRPGSVSKLFTWVAVMQLVEQGKIDLDADINTYLSGFRIDDAYPGQPVTMRHMMTHTSGFEEGFLGYLIIHDRTRIVPLEESLKKYQPKRIYPPGEHTSYSNYATALAGLIVQNVSGEDFSEYVQKNIFDVLGMKNATFEEPVPDRLAGQGAVPYAFKGGKYVELPFEFVSNFAPAGASSVSAADMLVFGEAILNGGEYNGRRILSERSVQQMLARNPVYPDTIEGVGLGFYELTENGIPIKGHHGATYYFSSQLAIDFTNNIVIFESFSSPQGGRISGKYVGAFYDAFFPEKEMIYTPPSGFMERAAKYRGTYISWRRNLSTIEKVFALLNQVRVEPTPDNTLLISANGKSAELVEVDKNTFRENPNINSIGIGQRYFFIEDDSGNITGLMPGHHLLETYRASFLYSPLLNFGGLALSVFVFVIVLLRLLFGRLFKPSMEKTIRRAVWVEIGVSGINLAAIILLAIVMVSAGGSVLSEIPLSLKLWFILPILATAAGAYLIYQTVLVWWKGLFDGVSGRLFYTVVTICAVFMCWFYSFWNLLGFHYVG